MSPNEALAQRDVVRVLGIAIDKAIAEPVWANEAPAIRLANEYPAALRTTYVRHNLGKRRWDWLTEHGVIGWETTDAAGVSISKATITPDVVK